MQEIDAQRKKQYTIEDIDSYEIACEILNKTSRNKESFECYSEWYTEQIKTIIRATNFIDNNYQEWKADFINSQYKYLPYFERKSSGWVVYSSCYFYVSVSCYPVWSYYKNEKSALYIAKKFKDLYSLYLGE